MASLLNLQVFDEAYRLSQKALRRYPDDDEIQRYVSLSREHICEILKHSVNKRLERAKRFIDEHNYEYALEELREIETDIIGPVEEEFPEIITEELQDLRSEARRLLTRAEQLPALSPQLEPLVHEALAAVYVHDVDAVRQAIAAAESIDPEHLVSHAWSLLDGFMALIESKQ